MPRKQRLIGGDDVLAAPDRFECERVRRLVASDQLDDDVDVRIAKDIVEV